MTLERACELIIERGNKATSLIEHLPGVEELEVFHVLWTSYAPIYHRGQIVEVAFEVLQVLLPGVASPDLKDPDLHVNVLEHLGVLADLKSAKLVDFFISQVLLLMPIESRECSAQFLFALDLRVVQPAVENDGDLMR